MYGLVELQNPRPRHGFGLLSILFLPHPEPWWNSTLEIYTRARTAILMSLFTAAAVAAPRAQAQTFQVIHNFTGGMGGASPQTGLTLDAAGNLYGTTGAGGGGTCNILGARGCGTVFKLKRSGSTWIFQPLYQFTGANDGALPASDPVIGPDGALYDNTLAGGQGTCNSIGVLGCGTIFKLTPPATFCRSVTCPWVETVLYRFTGGADGQVPSGNLVFGQDRNLYGTTVHGGSSGCTIGCGVVFELASMRGMWTQSVLYTFTGGADGRGPQAGVIFDSLGRLDGTTWLGGDFTNCPNLGCGTVFQLTHSGSGWTENVLYAFQGGDDGYRPATNVLIDSSDNLYGTTLLNGANFGGTVFELTPSGQSWLFNLLYSLTGDEGPLGKLIMDAAGNLYGTTYADGTQLYGSIFKLTHVGASWVYTSLHDFTGGSDGAYPVGGVVLDAAGNLYGTASQGGTSTNCTGGCGVIFKITP